MSVEVFSNDRDAPVADTLLAEVTGDFSSSGGAWRGLNSVVDARPQVGLGPFSGGLSAVQETLEAVDHSLVVYEDMGRSFSCGDQVEEGQGLSPLRVLNDVVDPRRMVETVPVTPVHCVGSRGQQSTGLVGACSASCPVSPGSM